MAISLIEIVDMQDGGMMKKTDEEKMERGPNNERGKRAWHHSFIPPQCSCPLSVWQTELTRR